MDFDLENRPLAYLGQDYTTAEITAICASWHDSQEYNVWLLGRDKPATMLKEFKRLYDEADLVTGHYIRMHDLPVINAAMLELGMSPLGGKLTCDTKMDLTSLKHLSASQENLAAALGILAEKKHMTNADWREANRLTDEGLKLTYKRVVGDVKQHKLLRARLVELNALAPPKEWRP